MEAKKTSSTMLDDYFWPCVLIVKFYHNNSDCMFLDMFVSDSCTPFCCSPTICNFLSIFLSDMFPDLIPLLSTNANSLPVEKGVLVCVCLVLCLLPWGRAEQLEFCFALSMTASPLGQGYFPHRRRADYFVFYVNLISFAFTFFIISVGRFLGCG